MNAIPETIAALVRREEELYNLMLSASDQLSLRNQSLQAAIENLASQISSVWPE